MDLKTDFTSYWDGITGGDPEFDDRKQAAEDEWNAHPEKHKAIMSWLKKHGPYSGRNPFFFIQDFKIRRTPTKSGQPHNYRGEIIPAGLQVFSAAYNGVYGMYTKDDIDTYGLTLPADQPTSRPVDQ